MRLIIAKLTHPSAVTAFCIASSSAFASAVQEQMEFDSVRKFVTRGLRVRPKTL